MKALVHKLGRAYQRRILQSEYEATRTFRRHDERPAEIAFLFQAICKTAPKTLLDVGCGISPLPAMIADCGISVTAIDNVRDYWTKGMVNRHWLVIDDDIQAPALSQRFDMVACVSVLEHIKDHRSAMQNMLRLLVPSGHLVLTCPYTEREYVEDVYRAPEATPAVRNQPYICRSYSRAELDGWLKNCGAELSEAQYWKGWTGRHWAIGDRVAPPKPSTQQGDHNLACFLIRRC